jgi:integrase
MDRLILCIGAGLRRAELDKLEWEQVCLSERRVHIRTTEFFRPKAKNSESYIDISEGVAAYLKEYKAAGENGKRRFVLPGLEVGDKIRCLKVFGALMTWLRTQGVPGRTPLHTLRKEAGSLIFQKAGSIDRAAEFLRNDPRIAREHYVGRKERIELEILGL